MAGGMIDMKNVVMFIKSATAASPDPVPDSEVYTLVEFGEGNLQWTMNDSYEYTLNRGILDDVAKGDQAPMDLSFEGKYNRIMRSDPISGEDYTIPEIVRGYNMSETDHGEMLFFGQREPWLVYEVTGSSQVACPPYAVALEVHNNPKLQCGDMSIIGEASLFRFFRSESCQVDTKGRQISVSGKCNIQYPMVRSLTFPYYTLANAAPLTDWVKDPRTPF